MEPAPNLPSLAATRFQPFAPAGWPSPAPVLVPALPQPPPSQLGSRPTLTPAHRPLAHPVTVGASSCTPPDTATNSGLRPAGPP